MVNIIPYKDICCKYPAQAQYIEFESYTKPSHSRETTFYHIMTYLEFYIKLNQLNINNYLIKQFFLVYFFQSNIDYIRYL
jgi:hypothetical protein